MTVLVSVTIAQLGALLRAAQGQRAVYARILNRPGLAHGVAQQTHEELQLLVSSEEALEQAREHSYELERDLERQLGPARPSTMPPPGPMPGDDYAHEETDRDDDSHPLSGRGA